MRSWFCREKSSADSSVMESSANIELEKVHAINRVNVEIWNRIIEYGQIDDDVKITPIFDDLSRQQLDSLQLILQQYRSLVTRSPNSVSSITQLEPIQQSINQTLQTQRSSFGTSGKKEVNMKIEKIVKVSLTAQSNQPMSASSQSFFNITKTIVRIKCELLANFFPKEINFFNDSLPQYHYFDLTEILEKYNYLFPTKSAPLLQGWKIALEKVQVS